MERTRRRVLGVCALAVALLAVVAAQADAAGSRAVKLRYWQTLSPAETATVNALVARYEKSHPNVDVVVTRIKPENRQLFVLAAQKGRAPDVMQAGGADDVRSWAAQNLLADLTADLPARDRSDFVPAALTGVTWQDKLYAVPQTVEVLALLSNRQMLASKGVRAAPATLGQVARVCARFPKGKGIALRGDSAWVEPWIWGYGGGLVDPAKQEILVAAPRSVQGWTAYDKLWKSRCSLRGPDFYTDEASTLGAFGKGDVAMVVDGPGAVPGLLRSPAFAKPTNLQVTPIPRGPGGQGSPIGGSSLVVSRTSKNPAEATAFVRWLTAPAQQAVLATRHTLLPSRRSAYALPAVKRDRIVSRFRAGLRTATEGATQAMTPDFTAALQKMLAGRGTPNRAAQETASAWKTNVVPSYTIVSPATR